MCDGILALLQDLHPCRLPDQPVRAADPPPALPVPPVDVRPRRQRPRSIFGPAARSCPSCPSASTTRDTWWRRATSPSRLDRATGSGGEIDAVTHVVRDGRRQGTVDFVDQRLGASTTGSSATSRKVVPDHWSFLLGEIALYSFIVLLLSGTFLTLFFQAVAWSRSSTRARTSRCAASTMSEAFASTLDLSFEVRGGLLMRQIHHWAALLFLAAMVVHMLRVFFTGAFRKPREINWLIGVRAAHPRLRRTASPATRCPTTCSPAPACGSPRRIMLSIPVVGTLRLVLRLRRRVPGRRRHPAALRRPHPAGPRPDPGAGHRALMLVVLPEAHPVPRAGPDRQERRRLPVLPGLHGQGRRLLLHRLRRHRADGGASCRSTRSGSTGRTTLAR